MSNDEGNKKTLNAKSYAMVVELQGEARSASKPTSDLLRHALVVSRSLKDSDFGNWLKAELDGYAQDAEVPTYREVRGIVKGFNPYRGWIPLIAANLEIAEVLEVASIRGVVQSVTEIENLLEQNKEPELLLYLPKQIETRFLQISQGVTSVALHVSSANFKRILESVRTRVLEWTTTFEQEEQQQPAIAPAASEAETPQPKKGRIRRFFAWVAVNKHWMFEGVGVYILTGVVTLLVFVFGLVRCNRGSDEPKSTNQQTVAPSPTITPTPEPKASPSPSPSPINSSSVPSPTMSATPRKKK